MRSYTEYILKNSHEKVKITYDNIAKVWLIAMPARGMYTGWDYSMVTDASNVSAWFKMASIVTVSVCTDGAEFSWPVWFRLRAGKYATSTQSAQAHRNAAKAKILTTTTSDLTDVNYILGVKVIEGIKTFIVMRKYHVTHPFVKNGLINPETLTDIFFVAQSASDNGVHALKAAFKHFKRALKIDNRAYINNSAVNDIFANFYNG